MFSAYFPGFLRVRKVREILGVFEGFLGILKDQGKEGQGRAAKRGCFKRGGFPIWTCPSFFVLFWDFPGDFPDLRRDGLGIFPIGPFPLSQPIKSTYEEQSRKGPRHNLDHSRKKWETPGFGNTPV